MSQSPYTWREWCDTFRQELEALHYQGPCLMGSFHDEWERGDDPKEAARSFVQEMTEP